jgi:hypothetical protein
MMVPKNEPHSVQKMSQPHQNPENQRQHPQPAPQQSRLHPAGTIKDHLDRILLELFQRLSPCALVIAMSH